MLYLRDDKLFIDDNYFSEDISVKINTKGLFYLKIESVAVSRTLLEFPFDNFENVSAIKMPISNNWLNSLNSITIFRINNDFFVALKYDVKVLVREVENLLDYYTQLFRFVEIFRDENSIYQISGLRVKRDEELDFQRLNKGFNIAFKIQNPSEKMIVVINDYLHLLKSWHLRITKASTDIIDVSLKAFFKFPEEIKVSCEQYLLYFTKFLLDLGINATQNLEEEEAGKVLFSLTPTDDIEALDKIREALAVYLNLPSSPIVYDDSFAAMRLQQQLANLEHAQRMTVREIQLTEKVIMIQSETIQEKNTIIAQKDSTIEQQNRVIEKIMSKSIMMDSVENKEELEEIYDGLKIGESKFLKEQLGIHLNPARVIKSAVKNTFGKDGEKKSILGLDEEI